MPSWCQACTGSAEQAWINITFCRTAPRLVWFLSWVVTARAQEGLSHGTRVSPILGIGEPGALFLDRWFSETCAGSKRLRVEGSSMQIDFRKAYTQIRASLVQLSHLPEALRLVWTPAPGWTAAWLVFLLIQGLLPIATVYVTRLLVDTLVQTTSKGGGWEGFRPTLFLAVTMGGLLLLTELLQSATEWVRANQSERIQDYIRILIHEKSIAVDLSFYDSPDFHDQLYRARQDASTRPLFCSKTWAAFYKTASRF